MVVKIHHYMLSFPRVTRDWITYLTFDPKRYWIERGLTYINQYPPVEEGTDLMYLKILAGVGFNSLIEIGCGYGRRLRRIAESFPHSRLVGVDISSTLIFKAREYLKDHPEIELRETNGLHLPYADKSFDISFTYGCMIHVPKSGLFPFFQEVCRVTREKGLFLESSNQVERRWFKPPAVYYYAHNYEQLFSQFKKHYVIVAEIETNIRERLYLVDIGQ